jgi:hypothetical protein
MFDVTFTCLSNPYLGNTLKHDVNWPENNNTGNSIIRFTYSFINSLNP